MAYRSAFTSGLVLAVAFGLTAAAPARAQSKPASEQSQYISEMIAAQWKANKVTPARKATDDEFLRRVFLDIIGRIATPEEVVAFESDRSADKRARLVNRLLDDKKYKEEYAKNWANIWTTWLLTRSGNRVYHDQMNLWLEEQLSKGTSHKEMVEKLLTATGVTNDNGAVNFILAHVGEAVPQAKRAEEGQFEMVPITSRTTRLFLGIQTQCCQCHDHPFNPELKQSHFWGVNLFFRQVEREGTPTMVRNQGAAKLTLKDNDSWNKDGLIYYETRKGMVMPTKPAFLDGSKIPAGVKNTRREMLAKFVTAHPNFTKAYVNRMWAHFFSRGMNEQPVADDFHDQNKVVHDELLTRLGKDFANSGGYSPKELIKWICNSEPYQLSCVANSTNSAPEKEVLFSRMLLKAMSPEQLFESLRVSTLLDKSENKDERRVSRERWLNSLLVNFGDDEGNEVTFNGTVVQALLMMNSDDLHKAITSKTGIVMEAYKKGNARAIMDHLFLATLNRKATNKEYKDIMASMTSGKVVDKDVLGPWQDLFWALVNSNEFILNH